MTKEKSAVQSIKLASLFTQMDKQKEAIAWFALEYNHKLGLPWTMVKLWGLTNSKIKNFVVSCVYKTQNSLPFVDKFIN